MFVVYTVFFISFLIPNDDLINAQLLYDENRYLDAKLLFETIEDKNIDVYYLGYKIHYKLDDLNKANEYLQLAVREDEDKYVEEGDKLGIFINDLRNAKVSLDNGFINESIEELNLLTSKYPGSEMRGVPASLIKPTSSPDFKVEIKKFNLLSSEYLW